LWFQKVFPLPSPPPALNIRIITIALLVRVEEISLAFTWQYCEFLERVVVGTQVEK
jgi:hypothetical protein